MIEKSITSEAIISSLEACIAAVSQLKEPQSLAFIEETAQMLVNCFRMGGKIILAGNGGSLCDAAHFAEELTGFFRGFRPALPAIVLNDPGHITCTANDLGFEWVFSRGIEAFGKKDDIFIGLTTSGNSANIVYATEAAKKIGLKTVLFLGKDGGKLRGVGDLELIIANFSTSDRIQEAHMAAIHLIIQRLEELLFSDNNIFSHS